GDLPARQLNAPQGLSLKRTVPARRLIIPGPHEDPALDDDDPHAGVAVLGPGADAEDLGLGKLLEHRPGESSCGGHVLHARPATGFCTYLFPIVLPLKLRGRLRCGEGRSRATGIDPGRMIDRMSEVTGILSAIEAGDPHAAARLLPLVYEELRRLAAQRL